MYFPFESEIVIEDERVLLRPIELADIENLMPVATHDKNLLQFSPKPVYTRELLIEYIETAIEYRSKSIRYTFCVYDKEVGKYAGSTSFLNISDNDDRLEIGATWYGKEFQRTGLNRHCKYLLLQYAFEKLNAERVELKTDERNTASRMAIEKIGGRFEGILRHHTLMHDGYRRNTVCYSILKAEWGEIKKTLLKEKS